MARTRNIKPSLFINEILGTADPIYTIMFQGLWCLADKEGRLEDRPLRIKAEVLPYRNGVDSDALLSWLEHNNFIIRYTVNDAKFIQVINFVKHQHPHKQEPQSNIPPVSCEVKKAYKGNMLQDSQKNTEQTPNDIGDNRTPSALNLKSLIFNLKKEETPLPPLARGDVCEPPVSEIPKPKPRGDIVKERFERFWNAYPRRVGKDAAFKAFQKKVTTAETLDDILKALKWQTECDDWLKEDGRFIPHPTTYLNQGRWHDEEQAECVDDYTAMMARIDAENEELSRQAKERKRLREEAMKAQGAANGL